MKPENAVRSRFECLCCSGRFYSEVKDRRKKFDAWPILKKSESNQQTLRNPDGISSTGTWNILNDHVLIFEKNGLSSISNR